MTPEEFLREKRRDAGVAFTGLACLLVAIGGALWGLNLWLGG
jgi:hypothetical protein